MSIKPTTVEHLGSVLEVTPNDIRISITSHSACSACHANKACGMSESKEVIVEVSKANQNYSVGEEVRVVLKQSLGYKAVLLAYGLPFIILILALIIFKSLGFSDGFAGIASICLLAPYFLLLYLLKDRISKTFSFEVEKIN